MGARGEALNTEAVGTAALLRAGWSAERRVAVGDVIRDLERSGFAVWPEVVQFFESFNGLSLEFVGYLGPDSAWLDGSRAAAWADLVGVEEFGHQVGARLTPVGYACRDHLLLLAADAGDFYASYDLFKVHLGRSPAQMVGALVNGEMTEIPPPEPELSDEERVRKQFIDAAMRVGVAVFERDAQAFRSLETELSEIYERWRSVDPRAERSLLALLAPDVDVAVNFCAARVALAFAPASALFALRRIAQRRGRIMAAEAAAAVDAFYKRRPRTNPDGS